MALYTSDRWRIFVESNNGNASYINICEIEMAGEPGGPDLCVGGTATSSSKHNSYPPDRAFNDVISGHDVWLSSPGSVSDQWIEYQFLEPVNIQEFRIAYGYDGTAGPSTQPRDFRLEFFNKDNEWETVTRIEGMGPADWGTYTLIAFEGIASIPPDSFIEGTIGTLDHRVVYALDPVTGKVCGYGTAQNGVFRSTSITPETTANIMVVDPSGKYLPEYREGFPVTVIEAEL